MLSDPWRSLDSRFIGSQEVMFISGTRKKKLIVTVPNHTELAKGTSISIMKQARLNRKDFIAALKE